MIRINQLAGQQYMLLFNIYAFESELLINLLSTLCIELMLDI